MCLVVIILCYGMIISLKDEDFGPVVIIGVSGSLLCATVCFILAIYYLIKAILQKQAYYKCRHCKNKFKTGLIIQHEANTGENLLKSIRKH